MFLYNGPTSGMPLPQQPLITASCTEYNECRVAFVASSTRGANTRRVLHARGTVCLDVQLPSLMSSLMMNIDSGTKITYVEATDPDDNDLTFDVRAEAPESRDSVPLLRIVSDGLKTASVYLNTPLNAVVRLHH